MFGVKIKPRALNRFLNYVSVGICTDLQVPMKARDVRSLVELELACDCELSSMDAGNQT